MIPRPRHDVTRCHLARERPGHTLDSRAAGRPVRALVRRTSDPATRAELERQGVELAYGDVRARASLDAACAHVGGVVSTVTTTRSRQPGDGIEATDHAGQLALVDAARAAGARRFVDVSYSGRVGGADPLTAWAPR